MNGVKFDDKHSFYDWGLLLKSRPTISPPSPKTVYVDIPGSDGIIDLTESLSGEVKYNTRAIKLEFQVIDARTKWDEIYSEILDFLHGRQIKIIFDEDPLYYYVGRFQVNEWKSDKVFSTIAIEGNVDPYKMELYSSLEDWLWDSFNFETGIIREYKDLRVNGNLNFIIDGRRKSVVPSFAVFSDDGKGMKVEFNGNIYDLPDGISKIVNIVTKEGSNTLKFIGNGTVSIDYRGGRL